jgi:hypothetical protein
MSSHFPDEALRYGAFRTHVWSSALAVVRGGRGGFVPDELEIQARWFGGEYGREFEGTEGGRVEIVQFGHWNRGAGPDFTEAAVRIDGKLRRGAIEVDLDVRDWERHGHAANRHFNEVVLHVFADQPALSRVFTRTEAHGNVAQVLLPQYSGLQGPPDFLPEAFPGRCLAPLARLSDREVASILVAAAQFRLRRKGERLHAMGEATGREQALFQAVAEALGYRRNKTSMAVLAQRCRVAELAGMDPVEREARLFGSAGFLPSDFGRDEAADETRTYLRQLWDRWWTMRDRFEPAPSRALHWRSDGTRPLNHPHRRLGALAALLGRWVLVRKAWEEPVNNSEKAANNWLAALSHPYWERHYSLGSEAIPKPVRLVGRDRLRDLLGNVVFPGAIGISPDRWNDYLGLGGVASNQKLRRATLRLFGPDERRKKLFTRYYHQQQGLLQIYEDFCLEDASDCRGCPFPEQLAQWREEGPLAGRGAKAGLEIPLAGR